MSFERFVEESQEPCEVRQADETVWQRIEDCPAPLLDAAGTQVGNLLYVVCGFENMSKVSDKIHVFDMSRQRWVDSVAVPDDLPNSHSAISTDDERYLYIAAGQLGANCSPAVPRVYCYDTVKSTWHKLPPLPAARYAGSMRLWRSRLHFVSGADVDRWTPTADHWSLGVSGCEAVDADWRRETPIPVSGMHRGIALVENQLYVFGGQQGDFKAIAGDPQFTCTSKTQETYIQSAFRLTTPGGQWERLADLPIAVSHCEFSSLVVGKVVYLFGGQIFKHPEKFYLRLTDAVQAYDSERNCWAIAGHMPRFVKNPIVGQFDKRIYLSVGQRGRGDTDIPGSISAETWASTLPKLETSKRSSLLKSLKAKNVLLVSHNLTRSGAPLELLELGRAAIESGAAVRAVTLNDDARCGNIGAEFKVPLVPQETALDHAMQADLIIVNTANYWVSDWVRAALKMSSGIADRMVWMIHEIDVEEFGNTRSYLGRARSAVFDSLACLQAWNETCDLPGDTHVVHPGLRSEVFVQAREQKQLFCGAHSADIDQTGRLLSRSEIRAELGVAEDEFLILSVGSFSKRKGQRLLLKSISRAARERQLPLKLVLVGFSSDEEKTQFLRSLDSKDRNVVGPKTCFVTTPHIDALFLASDAHVLNSQGEQGRGETFGRSTVQAMAHGIPALGTNAGGTPEIIEEGVQGFLYPVGTAGQTKMIEKIESLVHDVGLRRRLGAQGKVRANEFFQKDRYLRQMDEIFATVLAGNKTSRATK